MLGGRVTVELTERNAIAVDLYMRTNVPHIFAIGDVTANLMLAHAAESMGVIAAEPGPILAFCRSGTRSIVTWALGQAELGKIPARAEAGAGRHRHRPSQRRGLCHPGRGGGRGRGLCQPHPP